MLKFKAIKYKNKSSGFSLVDDTLPVKVQDGNFVLPSPDDILVKVHAASINPIDLLIKNGLPSWLFKGDKGFASDYAGEIAAIGANAASITSFKVGDRIAGLYQNLFGPGTCSEYILINPKKKSGINARKLADDISYVVGASYPLVLGTAQSLFSSIKQGNSYNKILILGAGTAVGRCSVQLANNVYNSKEIVVTCSGRTEKTIRELGASTVIDYTKHKSILQPVLESVKESGPFDAILDCCGNSDLFPEINHILKPRSEFGSYSTIAGDKKANFGGSIVDLVISNIVVGFRGLRSRLGLLDYYYTLFFVDPAGPWPDNCAKAISEKKVRMFIDSEYAMADIQKAADKLSTNKASGKIVIKVVPDN